MASKPYKPKPDAAAVEAFIEKEADVRNEDQRKNDTEQSENIETAGHVKAEAEAYTGEQIQVLEGLEAVRRQRADVYWRRGREGPAPSLY